MNMDKTWVNGLDTVKLMVNKNALLAPADIPIDIANFK